MGDEPTCEKSFQKGTHTEKCEVHLTTCSSSGLGSGSDLYSAVAAAHLHAGVPLTASISLRPVQLSGLQEVGSGFLALPQCIVGQGQVKLKVREPVCLRTGLSLT